MEKVRVPLERLLALSMCPNVGLKTLNQLLNAHELSPSESWDGSWLKTMSQSHAPLARKVSNEPIPSELIAKARRWIQQMQELEVELITRLDDVYPVNLRHIYDPPPYLWMRGRLSSLDRPLLSVVGTRRPTHRAIRETQSIVRDCAKAGLGIVSGLAQGIDEVAHRAALEVGGVTIAVLGTGINRIYPASNRPLANQILTQGGLFISEFPPGAPPEKHHFVLRNRIISGLSKACLLGQSAEKGGSMITQSYVKEQNRDFFVIPYAPSEPQSGGSLYAIRDGAILTRSASDILSESYKDLKSSMEGEARAHEQWSNQPLTQLQLTLVELCDAEPVSIDKLLQEVPHQRKEVLYALIELEWLQRIKRLPGDQYIRLE